MRSPTLWNQDQGSDNGRDRRLHGGKQEAKTGLKSKKTTFFSGTSIYAPSHGVKSKRHPRQSIAVKSNLVAYLLWLIGGFGVLGLHRFYLGRWVTGLLWFFTFGLFLIGALVDLLLIPSMVRVENLALRLVQCQQPVTGR